MYVETQERINRELAEEDRRRSTEQEAGSGADEDDATGG